MKYSGTLGLVKNHVRVSPGVYEDVVEEIRVRGDLLTATFRQNQFKESTIDNVTINNRISVLASKTLMTGMGDIRWATLSGIKWEVGSVTIRGNRLELDLTGVWNESD